MPTSNASMRSRRLKGAVRRFQKAARPRNSALSLTGDASILASGQPRGKAPVLTGAAPAGYDDPASPRAVPKESPMEIRVETGDIAQHPAKAIIANLFEGVTRPGGATGAVDKALGGGISQLIAE